MVIIVAAGQLGCPLLSLVLGGIFQKGCKGRKKRDIKMGTAIFSIKDY
jgi:hypothetical protein